MQFRAIEQIEHVRADDGRSGGVAAEHDRTPNGLGLETDIVIEELDEVALRAVERFGHRSRESAGAAEIRLRDDPQRLAERRGHIGILRLRVDPAIPLIDDEDAIDQLEDVR